MNGGAAPGLSAAVPSNNLLVNDDSPDHASI
jgi:hypothetical protein